MLVRRVNEDLPELGDVVVLKRLNGLVGVSSARLRSSAWFELGVPGDLVDQGVAVGEEPLPNDNMLHVH